MIYSSVFATKIAVTGPRIVGVRSARKFAPVASFHPRDLAYVSDRIAAAELLRRPSATMISPVTRKKSFDKSTESRCSPTSRLLAIILHNKDYAHFDYRG